MVRMLRMNIVSSVSVAVQGSPGRVREFPEDTGIHLNTDYRITLKSYYMTIGNCWCAGVSMVRASRMNADFLFVYGDPGMIRACQVGSERFRNNYADAF